MSQVKKSAGFIGTPDPRAATGPENCHAEVEQFNTTVPDAPPTSDVMAAEALRASGRLFSELASELHAAIDVVTAAIQCDDPAPLLVALRSLLGAAGRTADNAANALTGCPVLQDAHDWTLSPLGADALRLLDHMHPRRVCERRSSHE
jgi:hypothetical protein